MGTTAISYFPDSQLSSFPACQLSQNSPTAIMSAATATPPPVAPKPKRGPPPVMAKPSQAAMARARLASLSGPPSPVKRAEVVIAAGLVSRRTRELRDRWTAASEKAHRDIGSGNVAAMIQSLQTILDLREEAATTTGRATTTRRATPLVEAMMRADAGLTAAQASLDAMATAADPPPPMARAEAIIREMVSLTDVLIGAIRAEHDLAGAEVDGDARALVGAIFDRFGAAFGAFCRAAMEALTAIRADMASIAGMRVLPQHRDDHIMAMVIEFSKMTSINDDAVRLLSPKAAELTASGHAVDDLDEFIVRILEFVQWGSTVVYSL